MEKSTQQLVLEVHRDATLTQAEKMTRIQEIMRSASSFRPAEPPPKKECPQYQRGCWLVCDKCDEEVCCRLCHEEMDRFAVAEVVCKECRTRQLTPIHSVNKSVCAVEECGHVLGEYYCAVCHMFNNDATKPMFHCNGCGYCIGGVREIHPHCDGCGVHHTTTTRCKAFSYAASDGSVQECPVCLDPLKGANVTQQTSPVVRPCAPL